MASAEIERLHALSDWLITLNTWQDWVDSVDAEVLAGRITWPTMSDLTEFPQIVLELGGYRYQNITGAAAGSNFQPRGEIRMLIWDLDEAPDNTKTSYEYFAEHFYALIEELVSKAHESTLLFESVETEAVPIVHSSQNEEYLEDRHMWHGVIRIRWGTG